MWVCVGVCVCVGDCVCLVGCGFACFVGLYARLVGCLRVLWLNACLCVYASLCVLV